MNKRNLPRTAFKPGTSGNPKGKPRGTRNKATQAVMALLGDEAEQVTRVCVQAALAGDMTAVRLILERLAPPARERPVNITLPNTSTIIGVSEAQDAIVQAVAVGDLLPGEAATLANIIEARRKALESMELEARISALEAASDAQT